MIVAASIGWLCVGLFAVWQLVPDEAKNPDNEEEA